MNALSDQADHEAEVERLHTWDGLMSILDEHYAADAFPTLPDDGTRDPGPRIVSLIRHMDVLRADVERLTRERNANWRRYVQESDRLEESQAEVERLRKGYPKRGSVDRYWTERKKRKKAEAERDRYAQSLWDVLVTLGDDGDGDPSPAGHIAGMGHDGFAEMVKRSVRRHREDDDEALDEFIEAENQVKRLTAERDELAATVERVTALFSGGPDTPCRTTWTDGIECVEVPSDDLCAALDGEGSDTTVARVRALADEWEREGVGSHYGARAELRAALDGDPC